MLNEEKLGEGNDLVKLNNDVNEDTIKDQVNKSKEKKIKKVQFSDKNETIYYEKDENENSYFNFTLNNFNYFECFYNDIYGDHFNDKIIRNNNYNESYDYENNDYENNDDENDDDEEDDDDENDDDEEDDDEENDDKNDDDKNDDDKNDDDKNDDDKNDNDKNDNDKNDDDKDKCEHTENNINDEVNKSEEINHKNNNKNTILNGIKDINNNTTNLKKKKKKKKKKNMNNSIYNNEQVTKNILSLKKSGNNTNMDDLKSGKKNCLLSNIFISHDENNNLKKKKKNLVNISNDNFKREKFHQSFNEDSSFEINNIHTAILNAQERTIHYSKDYFGYDIEPFNMKNELTQGYIDKDGNYIYNESDNDEVEEAWLKSVDEQDPLSTFSNNTLQAQKFQETQSKFHMTYDKLNNNLLSINIFDALYSLSCLLIDEKETPIKAMIRYKKDLKVCKNYLNEYQIKIDKINSLYISADADEKTQFTKEHEQNRKNIQTDSVGKRNLLQVRIRSKSASQHEEESTKEENPNVEEQIEADDNDMVKHNDDDVVKHNDDDVVKHNDDDVVKHNDDDVVKHNDDDVVKHNDDDVVKHNDDDVVKHNDDDVVKHNDDDVKVPESNLIGPPLDKQHIIINNPEYESICNNEKAENQKNDNLHDNEKKNLIYNESLQELENLKQMYQKITLDYKTIERRFNNLIDLTQKLTNEYKNVYFLTKGEFATLCKKLEEYKENIDIHWQLKWMNGVDNNVYGPYNYYDIYNFITTGMVTVVNPILLRRINNKNEVLENIWQMYDAVNYLIFVTNDNIKKKRKHDGLIDENKDQDSDNNEEDYENNKNTDDDDDDYDLINKKKKKKGLIQISKKKKKKKKEHYDKSDIYNDDNNNEGHSSNNEEQSDNEDYYDNGYEF
ncbi:conserved Plasmodium protein, unknown function [Plasmodium sp. gorilla clade G3]|nr:conserved Plasmodium protein, unknown function [Plasmodium sp. gorilla clade G3]